MELQKQPDAKRNDFYPNCGCESEADCVLCPYCGMCTVTVEHCACNSLPPDTDASLRYDVHDDTLGG